MKFTATCILLLFPAYVQACIQFYVVDERGHGHIHEDYSPAQIHKFSDPRGEQICYYAEKFFKASGNDKYEAASDYAAILIKAGRSELALTILQKVIKKLPEEYNVLSNIAVAYELQGKYDSAWKYLNLAIKKDEESHAGSEWIHKLILGYARAQNGKANNFSEGSVLALGKDTSSRVAYHIGYQLQERVPLTSAPNELLSRTVEECADYFRTNVSLEWAIDLYAIAIAYSADPVRKNKLNGRVEGYMPRLFELNKKMKLRSDYKEKTWRKSFQRKIDEWSNYKAFRHEGEIEKIEF